MKWTEEIATGIPLLDEQHKGLFRCFDELEKATAESRMLMMAYAIDQLKSYARTHFSAEEHLMRVHDYPGLADHVAEHRRFTFKVFELMTTMLNRDISTDTVEFLRDWLLNHVSQVDMQYVPYLTGRVSAPAKSAAEAATHC